MRIWCLRGRRVFIYAGESMTNSRDKGKRGEREVARLLCDAGFMARRGQQFRGGSDSPDVICESLPWMHAEVKYREQHNAWEWMTQAAIEMHKDQVPVVFMRKRRQPWLVVLRFDDFITLAKAKEEK